MAYAAGKRAFGFCDRTGFRYPLSDLVDEYVNGRRTGLRVGRDVADEDHPQNFIGRIRAGDNQALRNPRPDAALEESRKLWGWNPVGNSAQYMIGSIGTVSVTTE